MLPFGARLVATFAALDATFKLLVTPAFFQVVGATGRIGDLVASMLPIIVPAWVLWLVGVWVCSRPIDRYVGSPESARTDDKLARAAAACARLPLRLALLWVAQWFVPFTAIVLVDGTLDVGVACFLGALLLGPLPLAHALAVWLSTPTLRGLDLVARERGVAIDLPRVTLRRRLTMYALCIAIAPSAYMAAIGFSARIQLAAFDTVVIAFGIGFLAVAVFAVLVTLLVSSALTRPVVEMASVVRTIADGSSGKIGRIPRHARDEIGELVGLTNEMIERLERTESERTVARIKLEQLAQTLEQRVDERTRSLIETRVSLEQAIAARSKVEQELAIAKRIQTSILPTGWNIEGLDVAAAMVTAAEVGGDYYDILPRPHGGWIGIGDVSGHGVGAGIVMLMVQSITATLVDAFPDASTRDLVVAIDRLLSRNIRQRLRADDFVTFTLLRYDVGGRVRYAGAHQDMIVWRAKQRRCELIPTPGFWIGVSGDIGSVTIENELVLEHDDMLVLYTDGITEAHDETREQFGIDRLCRTVEELAPGRPVDLVGRGVIERALAWCDVPQDDMSIVVARQH
jgi:serine phosphatase RsbU (regulator of sigma subunit)